MKRITMENCERLEDRKFKFIYLDGEVKTVQVAVIDKHIGMTCKICDASGNMTDEEALCFDFRNGDKYHSRAAFLITVNDIERGVVDCDKWFSLFVPSHLRGGTSLSDCAFQ